MDIADTLLPRNYKGEDGERRALGHKLAKWRGRELRREKDNHRFEFGQRDVQAGAAYTIRLLDD